MFSSSGADSLFLIAIFESDGYKATVQFQNIWEQYRSHLLAWESLQRLYEYSLALGDEEQAETLKRKLKSRPAESLPQNLNVKSCFFWVQTGAFSSEANALGQKQKLTNLGYCAIIIDQVIEGKKLKVVRAGSYATKNEAEQASKAIAKKLRIKPRVVSEGL